MSHQSPKPGPWRMIGTHVDKAMRLLNEENTEDGFEFMRTEEAEGILNAHPALLAALGNIEALLTGVKTQAGSVDSFRVTDALKAARAALETVTAVTPDPAKV